VGSAAFSGFLVGVVAGAAVLFSVFLTGVAVWFSAFFGVSEMVELSVFLVGSAEASAFLAVSDAAGLSLLLEAAPDLLGVVLSGVAGSVDGSLDLRLDVVDVVRRRGAVFVSCS
jgi:hypothetical protein